MQHEDPYRFVEALVGSDQSSDDEACAPPKEAPVGTDVAEDMQESDDDDQEEEYAPHHPNNGTLQNNDNNVHIGGRSGYANHHHHRYAYDSAFDDSVSSGGETVEEHPYLDMDEQRQTVASDRLENHMRWCDSMSERQRLSLDSRRCALKILVNEACMRDRMNTKKECLKVALYFKSHGYQGDSLRRVLEDHEREDGAIFASISEVSALRHLSRSEGIGMLYEQVVRCPSPVLMDRYVRDILDPSSRQLVQEKDSKILQQWRFVADQVVDDMECFDYSATVLKNLSCMSVFIPENISRDYGENFVARQERLKKMRALIDDLAMEDRLFVARQEEAEDLEEFDDMGVGVEEGLADSLSEGAPEDDGGQQYHEGSLDENELLAANCADEGCSPPESAASDRSDDYLLVPDRREGIRADVPASDEFLFL